MTSESQKNLIFLEQIFPKNRPIFQIEAVKFLGIC